MYITTSVYGKQFTARSDTIYNNKVSDYMTHLQTSDQQVISIRYESHHHILCIKIIRIFHNEHRIKPMYIICKYIDKY